MVTNQEIGAILLGALGGWLFAKYKSASASNHDEPILLITFTALGVVLGKGSCYFVMNNDAVTITSAICAIMTALFGFALFWKLIGGTTGRGVLALTMTVVPALIFLTVPSFPNFSEPLLRVISTAALGFCAGATGAWVIKEGNL